MVSAQFSEDMIRVLKCLQGKNFSYYMYGNDFGKDAYGKVRIATDTFAIDVTNIEEEFPFPGETSDNVDNISCFRCEKIDIGEQFRSYVEETQIAKKSVNEKIVSIEIVTDTIKIDQENYSIAMDMALIITTEKHRYVFSRDWYFSETIQINMDKNFDAIYPVEEVQDSWNNDGEYEVDVMRHTVIL